MAPKSILKNAVADATYRYESQNHLTPSEFDRKKVIENTRLNAATNLSHCNPSQPLINSNNLNANLESDELKWDEKNLLINEQEKSATMKIDEPKTPYEGGFDPNNDYYRTDNEDELEDLDDLNMGVGKDDDTDLGLQNEIEVVHVPPVKIGRDVQIDQNEENEQERKRAEFERKRKMHYHVEGNPLHRKVDLDIDGEDEGNDYNDND
ncbi:Glc8 protein [Martiniozyma asiatica (nom. inval.)]|nr:Glc8 protein [Martiniozyma asiatica]